MLDTFLSFLTVKGNCSVSTNSSSCPSFKPSTDIHNTQHAQEENTIEAAKALPENHNENIGF